MKIVLKKRGEWRMASDRELLPLTHYVPRTTHHALRLPQPSTRQSGIALVIVMISIFVLTVLAGGFAWSMKVETKLARNGNSEEELQWLGRSGVEYARWVLANSMVNPMQPYDSLDQPWATGSGWLGPTNNPIAEVQNPFTLGHGIVNWKIADLERKANINTVGEGMLQQAFILMGVDAGEMTPVINSILDWIDPDDQTRIQGAETEYYQGLMPPYTAKNGPIDDLSELLLIKGIRPEMYWGTSSSDHPPGAFTPRANRSHLPTDTPSFPVGLVELFTPLSGGKININTAPATVLQLIPNVDALVAEAIVSGRSGEDDGSGLMGPYRSVQQVMRVPNLPPGLATQLQQFCDVRSKTFKVNITATVSGYTRYFTAILGRNSPRDIQVLSFYWTDAEDQKR
jgi:general secretion pathway protein K